MWPAFRPSPGLAIRLHSNLNHFHERRQTDSETAGSIWGYAVILGLSWEYALITGVLSLPNGGTAGAVWMFLITCICMMFVVLSMAEVSDERSVTSSGIEHC